jgi:hypothetical protein
VLVSLQYSPNSARTTVDGRDDVWSSYGQKHGSKHYDSGGIISSHFNDSGPRRHVETWRRIVFHCDRAAREGKDAPHYVVLGVC